MYLVKKDNVVTMRAPAAKVGGLAGWCMEWAHVLWLSAKMRGVVKRERQMRVVETLSLGGRKQLMLVSCGGEQFLVGTGGESVQTMVRVRRDAVEGKESSPVKGFGEPV